MHFLAIPCQGRGTPGDNGVNSNERGKKQWVMAQWKIQIRRMRVVDLEDDNGCFRCMM
ncbi:hypothetical protein SLEP1_g45407 [Rubroshorea leprosula]|uniref:Uncharacterized protein n=1 Tax=Rubroshorea leprosula TaxID=152421 RepID=A0AAV5LJQ9_9ROSI|nr:hypothetical protein SLEP1_g45407 [Rubroshorea leprosula]